MSLALTRSSRARDLDLWITAIAGIISGIGFDCSGSETGLGSETGSNLISEICSAGFLSA